MKAWVVGWSAEFSRDPHSPGIAWLCTSPVGTTFVASFQNLRRKKGIIWKRACESSWEQSADEGVTNITSTHMSYNVLILSLIVTGNTVPGTNLGVSSTSRVQFFKTKRLAWPTQFPFAWWLSLSLLCLAFFSFWCIHRTISLCCLKFPILGLNSEAPWLLVMLRCWRSKAQRHVADCLATGSTTHGPRRVKPAWPSTLGKDLKLLTVLHTRHFLDHCYTPWLLAGIFSPELRNSEEKNIVSPLPWSVT